MKWRTFTFGAMLAVLPFDVAQLRNAVDERRPTVFADRLDERARTIAVQFTAIAGDVLGRARHGAVLRVLEMAG